VSMAEGLATLELLSAAGFHERLGKATDLLVERLRQAATRAGVGFATNHACGMFGFFFTNDAVVDSYAKVMASDAKRFNRFFHAMIAHGVYFAPSAFESGFLSAAHTPGDIDATVAAAERAFAA